MTDSRYYIAKDNYSLHTEDGRSIDICIGNQFELLEDLHNENLKLKSIDSSLPNLSSIILPCSILEDMSTPSPKKSSSILRSQSSVKERIRSVNLYEKSSEAATQSRLTALGDSSQRATSIFESSRSRTLPASTTSNSNQLQPSELRRSLKNKKNDIDIDSIKRVSSTDNKWMRVIEGDNDVYINVDSGDRWLSAVDGYGRQYYYDEVTLQSNWVLPGNEVEQAMVFDEAAVNHLDDVLHSDSTSTDDEESIKDGFEGGDNNNPNTEVLISPSIPSNIDTSLDMQENDSRFNIKLIKKEHISTPLFNKWKRTEKSGLVDKTKFCENGRELSKKWSNFYVVLTGPELLFYNNIKAATAKPGMPQGKVDLKLKIQNLEFTTKPEPGSKYSMLQIVDSGAPGSSISYLLRYNNLEDMQAWKTALEMAKNWQNENMYAENSFKTVLSPVEDISADKQNIGIKLKQFLKRRPTRESLEASGILKLESVFGSSLDILCEHEPRKVPEFVFRCIMAIEARGLQHNGIYRISGNQAKIQKLRLAIDEHKYQLNTEFIELETLTGALKSFFKELKEPLFDEEFCTKMVALLSQKSSYRDVNQSAVKKLIGKMKPSHYETAKVLFAHLQKVAALCQKNLMDISNLAMVWGPNLYMVAGQASTRLAMVFMTHNQIIDYLLTFYSELFLKT